MYSCQMQRLRGPFHHHFACDFVIDEGYLATRIKKSANLFFKSVVLDDYVDHGKKHRRDS